MKWMFLPFKRYVEFSGRSRRMEFWMFTLLNIIVAVVLAGPFYFQMIQAIVTSSSSSSGSIDEAAMIESLVPSGITLGMLGLYGIFALAALLPSIAVTVRRLHDRNMSGWWYLGFIVLSLVPYVGFIAGIAFLVVMLLDGTPGTNRFGADPKGRSDVETFS